ncbi:hypothetical protein [Taibaiella sp. KBW10]|nr:hypothetical protein [Taibaiella sp. KBW10]
MKWSKMVWALLVATGLMIMLSGCGTSKKGCGCGNDINRMYQKKR